MVLAQTIILFICVCSVIAVIYSATRTKKPLLKGTACALCGAAALGAVNLVAQYTGVGIALNYASAFTAIVLGIPGVVLMLVLRIVLLF